MFRVLLLLCALSGVVAQAQTPASVPAGWRFTGRNAKLYALNTDSAEKHGGVGSATLRLTAPTPDDIDDGVYGVQSFKANLYWGKRVRLTAWMKTQKADGASLWFQVSGRTDALAFGDLDKIAPTGTMPWTKYSLTLDVPERAQRIVFGFQLTGRGQMWVDDIRFETVGADIPTTDFMTDKDRKDMEAAEAEAEKKENGVVPPAIAALPDAPANLDFETLPAPAKAEK